MNTLTGMTSANGTTSSEGPFCFWDGEEVKDGGYCLFGASVGGARPDATTYILGKHLRTTDMLELLLDVAEACKSASHVAFAFDYDVNYILNALDWSYLSTLHGTGRVEWGEYVIEHIPHKIFKVKRGDRSIRIDDVFSYFRCRYDKALRKYNVGGPAEIDEIAAGKDKRADFWWKDINEIRRYWGTEVSLGCDLMEKIRAMSHRAGYHVKAWYGPGALAAYSLTEHKTTDLMKPSPPRVHGAALSAYAGGWFERYRMGVHDGPVFTWDINSAYVYAMSLLPDLSTGHWEHVIFPDKEVARSVRFGLFRVAWKPDFNAYMRACHGVPLPLFHRDSNGSIHRPTGPTDVWLWNPEAANASATPYAKLMEGWIYHDDGTEPFKWVDDMYTLRLALQAENDPSEKILKWAMASYYGRLAQRAGWNERTNRIPRFHQIEWAGWITSKCRAMVFQAAFQAGCDGGLVSVDTDGIISTCPITDLPNGLGNQLGRWKAETYDGLIYLQNGVYWLQRDGKWEDPKLRGIPRTRLSPEIGLEALRNGGLMTLSRRTFTGYGAALQGRRGDWLTWGDHDLKISAQQAGSRIHVPQVCRTCLGGVTGLDVALHDLAVMPARGSFSTPHKLPWLGRQKNFHPDWIQEHLITELCYIAGKRKNVPHLERIIMVRKTLPEVDLSKAEMSVVGADVVATRRNVKERSKTQQTIDGLVKMAHVKWVEAGKPETFADRPGGNIKVPESQVAALKRAIVKAGVFYDLTVRFGTVVTEKGYADVIFTVTDRPNPLDELAF